MNFNLKQLFAFLRLLFHRIGKVSPNYVLILSIPSSLYRRNAGKPAAQVDRAL